MSTHHLPRGFILVRLLWRFFLTIALGVSVGVGLRHHTEVVAAARAVVERLQALVPVGAPAQRSEAVDAAYQRLKDDSLAALYDAGRMFAAAAQAADHDVAARAGQADAQVALARAYSASAALMDAYAKTLRNAERRAADRLVRAERKEAQAHLKQGQQFAKEALRLAPTAFVAHRAMAGVLLQGGRLERARPYLAQAGAARPQDVGVRLLQAEQQASKDTALALTTLGGVLASDPGHHGARFRLALLHWGRGERSLARDDALTLLAGSPGHALARRLLMELEPLAGDGPHMSRLMALPKEAEVLQLLPPLAQLSAQPAPQSGASAFVPSRATTVAWLAKGARLGGRCLSWGLEQSKGLAVLGQQGVVALWATAQETMAGTSGPPADAPGGAAGATTPAASSAQALATAATAPYATWVSRARAFEQRHARAEAENAWAAALTLRPDSTDALVALGWCRLQAHDLAVAQKYFSHAEATAPKSAEAQFGLAEALRMGHDKAGARLHYGRYLELEPKGPLSPLCRQMLEELGREG